MRRVCLIAMLVATSALSAAAGDSTSISRSRFIARHRCAVVERLDLIHRKGPIDESRDRFIILSPRGEPQRYVQCMFEDRDTRMLCEASSGAYGPIGHGRLRLDASARAALEALGFVQASPREDYVRHVELGHPPDVAIAADVMLTALHDGFGARPGSPIEIWVPYGGDPVEPCGTPVS